MGETVVFQFRWTFLLGKNGKQKIIHNKGCKKKVNCPKNGLNCRTGGSIFFGDLGEKEEMPVEFIWAKKTRIFKSST